jgi:hypothetical protein
MPHLVDLEAFEQIAKRMVREAPKATRLSTKYQRAVPVLTLKITNSPEAYKIEVTRESQVKQAHGIISAIMPALVNPPDG